MLCVVREDWHNNSRDSCTYFQWQKTFLFTLQLIAVWFRKGIIIVWFTWTTRTRAFINDPDAVFYWCYLSASLISWLSFWYMVSYCISIVGWARSNTLFTAGSPISNAYPPILLGYSLSMVPATVWIDIIWNTSKWMINNNKKVQWYNLLVVLSKLWMPHQMDF